MQLIVWGPIKLSKSGVIFCLDVKIVKPVVVAKPSQSAGPAVSDRSWASKADGQVCKMKHVTWLAEAK